VIRSRRNHGRNAQTSARSDQKPASRPSMQFIVFWVVQHVNRVIKSTAEQAEKLMRKSEACAHRKTSNIGSIPRACWTGRRYHPLQADHLGRLSRRENLNHGKSGYRRCEVKTSTCYDFRRLTRAWPCAASSGITLNTLVRRTAETKKMELSVHAICWFLRARVRARGSYFPHEHPRSATNPRIRAWIFQGSSGYRFET